MLTGEQLFVNGDMGKIQQVLYNLLDNAIKFSHSDSVIKIETTEKRNKVFVSIKDSGIGIPKESLKLIWDRFYKTDLSRGKDKKAPAWACPSPEKSFRPTMKISMLSAPKAWALNLSSACL
mgnify:CR=1 FL=1